MQEHYTPKGKHLTIAERYFIEKWKSEGKSNRTIAGLLGKAPQTIHNEVKRGLVRQQIRRGKFEMVYQADYAQDSYEMKRRKSVRSVGLDKDTKDKILHYMKQNFSPEMMVRTKGVAVPISTIYYWIHQGHLGIDSDWMLYPRKKRGKRKKASPRFKPAGQSIEERPDAINRRLENGHYEIDTVILTRAKNECLLTLTDRRSRHQIIRLIPDKSARSVNQALESILEKHTIYSITADNGTEFNRLSLVFPEENIYYAHPYASWERGTNENHNRLIRRWLPKGTKKTTLKQVAFIENWINNYPKKILNYKSPREFLKTG
jgi:IS30 family transposase